MVTASSAPKFHIFFKCEAHQAPMPFATRVNDRAGEMVQIAERIDPMRHTRIPISALLSLAALLLSGFSAAITRSPDEHPARVAVSIENYAFEPDPISIVAGTTVVWTNHDEVAHSVVSNDKLFSSPELEVNRSFEFTFKRAGTFSYFCSIHPEMKGKVIVK